MQRLPLAVLLLSSVALAQQPSPEVTDLLSVEARRSRADAESLVLRTELIGGGERRHEWTTLDGKRHAFVCRVDWQPAEVATSSVWVSPLLQAPVLGFRSTRGAEGAEPDERTSASDLLEALLRAGDDGDGAEVVPFAADHGSGAVVLRGQEGQRFARELERRLDEALAPCRVAIEVFDAPAGAAPGADGARLLWSCAGPAIVGLPSCFTTGNERSYLRDHDVEVAQGARIADPKVSLCEDGWFATVKPLPARAGAPRRVELALDCTNFLGLEELELGIAGQMVAATESGRFSLAPQVVRIERPRVRQASLGGAFELDQGGVAVMRRGAARLLGPGRELVVRVQVQ